MDDIKKGMPMFLLVIIICLFVCLFVVCLRCASVQVFIPVCDCLSGCLFGLYMINHYREIGCHCVFPRSNSVVPIGPGSVQSMSGLGFRSPPDSLG